MAFAAQIAENRASFNRASGYNYTTPRRQPKKRSRVARRLRNIFLLAVVGVSTFIPLQKIRTNIFRRPESDVTDVQTQDQMAQSNYMEAEEYVSPRAGKPMSSRGLTAGEVTLIRGLFGDKIDLNGVRLHTFAKEDRNYSSDVMPGETKNVEFYGQRHSSEDFSRADASRFGGFVHEMTFLLQNQQGADWRAGTVEGYDYPLNSRFRFSDYGPAQQRAIVQDYALRFLHPDRQSHYLPHQYGDDRRDTDPFLISLVENHFRGAREMRIAFQNIETRGLTPGEVELLVGIFGDQINPDIMRQHMHPEAYSDVAGTATSGRDANYWGPRYSSEDYSKESSAEKFGTFIHENTHLWQFQTHWRHSPQRPDVYRYPLEQGRWKFTDYTHEQQAAMVEDYALYYLHSSHRMRWMPETYNRSEQQQKLPILRDLVETQFPGAKALRQSIEARRARGQPVPVAMNTTSPYMMTSPAGPAYG